MTLIDILDAPELVCELLILFFFSKHFLFHTIFRQLTVQFADRHGACERGRDEKHAGYREEQRGQHLVDHGHDGRGYRDESRGQHEVAQGSRRECRAGGRC
jgi:hypothetical protein